jgi:hypothetical protein
MKYKHIFKLTTLAPLLILVPLCASESASTAIEASTAIAASTSSSQEDELAPPEYKLSPEQIETFNRDGVIIIRGLIQGKELKNAIRTAKKLNKRNKSTKNSIWSSFLQWFNTKVKKAKLPPFSYRSLAFQTWRKYDSIEYVAFDSNVPSIVAQLMGYSNNENMNDLESSCVSGSISDGSISDNVNDTVHATVNDNASCSSSKSIRLLRDAFLSYQDGGEGCGWHVDDKFFWPCEDTPIHTRDAGINVWITLSPIKASEGGGLSVAPTSHVVPWREEARSKITDPKNPNTCDMENLSPEFHNKFEELKMTYDLQPGDAIFHDRYVFHAVDKFKKERKLDWLKRSKFRISLRYMPGDAKAFVGQTEVGFIEKEMETGDQLSKGEEYFPQVWPTSLNVERSRDAKYDTFSLSMLS